MQKESGINKLNILNLATSDEGGAGIATQYYNDLFRKYGHNSILIVKKSDLKNNGVIVLQKKLSNNLQFFFRRVAAFLKRNYLNLRLGLLDPKYIFFYSLEKEQNYSAKKILNKIPFKPDVINVFWISNFLNSKTIRDLQQLTDAKIFLFMTDNSPITGGCHYPWDCKGFEKDCSDCPALLLKNKKKIAKDNLSFKSLYFPDNLNLIVGSESDYQRALSSYLFKSKSIHKILAPIDENKFLPSDKRHAKAFFGIDSNKKVIFNGSISYSNPRKGSVLFQEALILLQKMYQEEGKDINDLLVLIAGNDNDVIIDGLAIPTKRVPYLTEIELVKAYVAADVFVSSSLEDSGPLMVNQSLMCGTPVVSFDIGVAIDLIENGTTGFRVKLGNVQELALGIKLIFELDLIEYIRMSENCRNVGIEKSGFNNALLKLNQLFSVD